MLKPVQRLPQYKLLLEDYLRRINHDSVDFDDTTIALRIVSDAADHANNTIRQGVRMYIFMPRQPQQSLPTTHCAKLNKNEKKTEQVPIQLPNIARTLSDAKKIIKKNSFIA